MKLPLIPTTHALHGSLPQRGPLKSPLSALFILALSCVTPSAHAQWIGAGTPGGTGDTNFNNTSNWTNGIVSGTFSGNTTSATISLSSATTTLTDLNCYWSGTNTLTINGDGTGDNEVINISGNIYVPRGTTAATVTIGSDVTINLGTISTTRNIVAGGTTGNAGTLVINGILTGTATGSGTISLFSNSAGTLTLNNTNNTFDAPLAVYGTLNFASINNVGGGASALGLASTAANGTISLGRNGMLLYSGTVDQSSNRQLSIIATQGPIGIGFTSTGSGKLTYSSNLAMGAFVGELRTYATLATATLELDGAITSTASGTTSLNTNYNGGVGTTILTSGASTYTGITTVDSGVLQVTKLADGGQASSIGASSNAATNLLIDRVANNGTLKYVGAGDSTDRLFTIRVGGLDASGSGAIKFTNTGAIALSAGRSAYRLTLTGTNTGDNLLAASLGDGGTSTVVHTTLTKSGIGKWILTGAHSYTGATSVNAGTLQIGNGVTGSLNSSSAITVAAGAVLAVDQATGSSFANAVANSGNINGAEDSGITNTFSGIISGTGTFSQTGAGVSILSNANTFSGAVNVNNGVLAFTTVSSGSTAQALGKGNTVNIGVTSASSGTLQYTGAAGTLTKNIYALGSGLNTVKNSGSGLLTLSGSLVKNGTVLVLDGGSSGINVTGTISGSSANSDLYITGGTTTLSATNTYNGPTWVYGGGTLVNGVSNALPTDTTLILGGTDNSNGTFDLNGKNQSIAGLSGTGAGTQTVTNNGADASILTVTAGGTYNGVITNGVGTTALTVSGGNLVLGGSNSYTGATTVNGGTLTVNGSLAADSAVTVTGATLAGRGSASGAVSGSNATITGTGLTLGITTLRGTSTLSGYNIASSVTVASGTTTLSGTTKSTSALSVSAGATLNADGTIAGSATVGGLLKGNSTITGDLTLTSGTLAPGNSSGITKVQGNFSTDASSTLVAEVSGTVAGTSYDQVQVSGNVTLAGTLDLSTLSSLTVGSTITLIDNTGSGTTTGYFVTLITSGSTYTLTSNSNYTFTVGSTEYLLSYTSSTEGDGYSNDVTLTVVPEPSTWAMVMGGIGMLAFGQRLRHREVD
ncbi:MAG: autotransporter-associated beta strand repeat-containing protein [Chthoniobacteraceae bacterium]